MSHFADLLVVHVVLRFPQPDYSLLDIAHEQVRQSLEIPESSEAAMTEFGCVFAVIQGLQGLLE